MKRSYRDERLQKRNAQSKFQSVMEMQASMPGSAKLKIEAASWLINEKMCTSFRAISNAFHGRLWNAAMERLTFQSIHFSR
jgi:hypothetical protein